MTIRSLRERLAEELSDQASRDIASSIFSTANLDHISTLVERYCHQQFQRPIVACSLVYFSVGATFVVFLANQPNENPRQVVIKAYNQDESIDSLQAIAHVQTNLANAQFPCPQVLVQPTRMEETLFTTQSFHDPGDRIDPFSPSVNAAMAKTLAQLMQHTKAWTHDTSGSMPEHLPVWMEINTPSLWHTPHNVLFDFVKTAAGAEWIDDIARQTKPILQESTGPRMLGHSDWSLQNMSFCDGQLTCVYDWDSLRVGLEPWFVGGAARYYAHDWRYGPPKRAIALDEVRGFIRLYEEARGQPFSSEEQRSLGAALVYTAAYGVRCMHAISPATLYDLAVNASGPRPSEPLHVRNAKRQLLQFADAFL